MASQNPYSTPEVDDAAMVEEDLNIEKVASGQKTIIYGILIYFVAIFLQFAIGPIAGLLGIVSMIFGIIGIVRLSRGLDFSAVATILLIIVMIIPLIGLIVLLSLNGKATKALKNAGYTVGLLGASKPTGSRARRGPQARA